MKHRKSNFFLHTPIILRLNVVLWMTSSTVSYRVLPVCRHLLDVLHSSIVSSLLDSSLDHKYREIFLSTHMMFITCMQLFEGLSSRFEPAKPITDAQLRSTMRYKYVPLP
jgi:hypothetical protein